MFRVLIKVHSVFVWHSSGVKEEAPGLIYEKIPKRIIWSYTVSNDEKQYPIISYNNKQEAHSNTITAKEVTFDNPDKTTIFVATSLPKYQNDIKLTDKHWEYLSNKNYIFDEQKQ